MQAPETARTVTPTLFLLHALGSSQRGFGEVASRLGGEFRIVAIDLPGFGDVPAAPDASVAATVDHAIREIVAAGATRWLLVGHSMGGKIASIVARRALDGEPGLFGLEGVLLLAGSPPGPEPMDETRRAEMLGWAADGPLSADSARRFVDANVGAALSPERDALAVSDLRRCDPAAWTAWLARGSREDWSTQVGRLDLPCSLMVGSEDGDLGEAGQRRTNALVYPRAELRVLPGAGHLLPLERPDAVAEGVRALWRRVSARPAPPEAYARLIASDRVGRRVRAAHARRISADDAGSDTFSASQMASLRAIADLVVPQPVGGIDLAARVAACLARGEGDGWRDARLPGDLEAGRKHLDRLADLPAMAPDARRERLERLAAGSDAAAAWFADLRADLVRHWLSHPATMAAIGFDGFANGGDVIPPQGFDRVGANEREAWEP